MFLLFANTFVPTFFAALIIFVPIALVKYSNDGVSIFQRIMLGAVWAFLPALVFTVAALSKSTIEPLDFIQQEFDKNMMEVLSEAAAHINARAPFMVDQETRLDKTVAGPGSRFTYFYSFPNYSSRDIERDRLLADMRPEVKKRVCGSEETKQFLQYGVIYTYAYSGNDGAEIARFELSKHDCGY